MNGRTYTLNDILFGHSDIKTTGLRSRGFAFLSRNIKEIAYQTVIILVLLVFFSFEMDESQHQSLHSLFEPAKLAFFLNYLSAAMLINYVLLPVFYYAKRILLFTVTVCALLTLVILIDEFVLEQIFYPTTRGTHFPGLVFTLVETLPIIIIIVAFKLAWDSNRKQSELERLKNLVKESEIQFLKSQINPHFLFNNLNNLYASAIENSPKTPSIILELSAVLRYMLYDCQTDLVSFCTEITHLSNYIALSRLHIENRGKIQFDTQIAVQGFSIPPLILIVFVENALKHSARSLKADIDIHVGIQLSETGVLNFICRNNHSPFYQSSSVAKGIGLENVRKRLDLQYQGNHELEIKDHEGMFLVKLTMQLK